MDWENLKVFLELARAGTLTGAARQLGWQHSTVARRIARFELEMGKTLFTRAQDGYRLNRAGQALLGRAETAERAILALGGPEGQAVQGVVRLGLTEGFASWLLPATLGDLAARHPGLELDLIVEPRVIRLPRNEADIVINIDRPERGPYRIRRLLDYDLSLYAAPAYLARMGRPQGRADLARHIFIDYRRAPGPAKGLPSAADLREAPPARLRSASLHAQIALVAQGAGIALLPRYALAGRPDLECLLEDQIRVRRSYWISMAEELRELPRIRAVWEALIAGSRPPL